MSFYVESVSIITEIVCLFWKYRQKTGSFGKKRENGENYEKNSHGFFYEFKNFFVL